MNINERFDRFEQFRLAGKLTHHAWGDGKELACWRMAIAPDLGTGPVCPVDSIPAWVIALTPWMDDSSSEAMRPAHAERYGRVMRRAALTLDESGWRRALLGSLVAILRVAEPHNPGDVATVIALLERELAGGVVEHDKWASAHSAMLASAGAAGASAAARAALWAAARAVEAARAEEAVRAALWAADEAVEAAKSAVWAAEEATEEAEAADAAETEADRVIEGILDAIEAECKDRIEQ